MDILGPIGPIDTKMAMEIQRQGVLARLLSCIHYILPDPPVSAAARLSALPSHDAVDRVSRLPDALLGDIVSRLPVKDAGRTAALSRRWRGVWRSAPLVLVDADLLPVESTAGARADARRVTSAVSRVLAAHPGPFRCVHLTSSYLEEFHGPLTRWFDLLVANGIQELVLVSRRWPLNIVLPATFLDMATLTRLYLGLWKFPDTTGLPRAASFPNLLELGLCGIFMDSKDLDYILDRSPVLETLYVEANLFKLRLRLVSQSLRCILLIGCFFEEIFVVDAPRLERIILSEASTPDDSCTKVKIGHAPNLNLLGCLELDPGTQVLEVGNTVIKGRTRVSPSSMVPSVRILALEVRFGVRNDAKMIPSVLRCFPDVETLHIKSGDTDQSTGKLNLKFWHESGTIECIRSSIKLLVLHDFRGDRSELAFLRYFFESALVLKEVVILVAASVTSMEEVDSKVASLRTMKRASKASSVLVTSCSDPEGGYIRSIKRGSDFSLRDPFANYGSQ
ncbi:F-box/FBD/LRR-repeat protein At5g22660 [Lolium perenne]|uniref:F-box/FBD/LRR-repeat protein At5g22660 n=1 Tax=Lolium perenne TaxID=4522 RepID=UPI0021F60B9F|nr:F-box/FBD/LRR-repeat protein At5g22660-like [Lolium perenne]